MKKLVLIAALLAAAAQAQAQTFNETARAFRKLEAKLDAGTSYSRYSEAMEDLQFVVGEYAANANEANRANVEGFRRALDGYKLAGWAWGEYRRLHPSRLYTDKQMGFDEVTKTACPGVALGRDGMSFTWETGVGRCLNRVWSQAGEITKGLREVPDAAPQK